MLPRGLSLTFSLGVVGCTLASAITSCSGDVVSGAMADAGPDVDIAAIRAPPKSALRQVSVTMTRVNLGDSSTTGAWKAMGFDLDDKITTTDSTDVCQLVPGAALAEQVDGEGGIDNSFGENLCPIFDSVDESAQCFSDGSQTYLVTDASGSGTLTLLLGLNFRMKIPITDAYVVLNGDGSGMLGAVAPTVGLTKALVEAADATNYCLMAGGQPDVTRFAQASDILSDGSNSAGQQCDAISIGMQFWGATSFDGALPDLPDACAD